MAFWTQIIISTSGGSITLLSPVTGSADGSNQAFGFSTKPKTIVIEGAGYRENHGWTWNAGSLTATLDAPPRNGSDVYAIQ